MIYHSKVSLPPELSVSSVQFLTLPNFPVYFWHFGIKEIQKVIIYYENTEFSVDLLFLCLMSTLVGQM